jgi:HNH endonuclease
MDYENLFRMPVPIKITGRTSTITNAFVNAIIPSIRPSIEQIREALRILGMTEQSFRCAYCGDQQTEWDHLRPLVRDKRPTGYISEIHNLVPCCGKCNQSKGNKEWRVWIKSDAKLSPKQRNVKGLAENIKRLEAYEKWSTPVRRDFEAMVGKKLWAKHWQNLDHVFALFEESQKLASVLSHEIARAYRSR